MVRQDDSWQLYLLLKLLLRMRMKSSRALQFPFRKDPLSARLLTSGYQTHHLLLSPTDGRRTMIIAHLNLRLRMSFWQSNEVKSSVHMEKEGLVQSVGRIKSEKLNIGNLSQKDMYKLRNIYERKCQILPSSLMCDMFLSTSINIQSSPAFSVLSHNWCDTPGLVPLVNVLFLGRCDFSTSFPGRDMSWNVWNRLYGNSMVSAGIFSNKLNPREDAGV